VRRSRPRFALPDPQAPAVAALDGVAALSFDVFDGRDWLPTWSASRPPQAVRVRIRFADGESASAVAAIPIAPRRTS
jgi:hypothetical protein